MLRIIVEIVPPAPARPKREVARAELSNVSDGKISDYEIEAEEGVNGVTFAGAWEARGLIAHHDREQSVWALVAKAAMWAAAEAEKQGGERVRIVARPESFPESVLERIRKIAEGEPPDEEEE
jgi:hypothetical protein